MTSGDRSRGSLRIALTAPSSVSIPRPCARPAGDYAAEVWEGQAPAAPCGGRSCARITHYEHLGGRLVNREP